RSHVDADPLHRAASGAEDARAAAEPHLATATATPDYSHRQHYRCRFRPGDVVETFGSEGAIFGLSDSFDRSVGKVGLGGSQGHARPRGRCPSCALVAAPRTKALEHQKDGWRRIQS